MRLFRQLWTIALALAVTLVLVAAPPPAAARAGGPAQANPLNSRDATWVLKEAQKLAATPEVAAAKAEAKAFLLTTQFATTSPAAAQNRAALDGYLNEFALGMCVQAAGDDPYLPTVYWSNHYGWRFGLDNPDNIYRQVRFDGGLSYEIRGRRNTSTFAAFQLFDGYYGDTDSGDGSGNPNVLGFLDAEQLQTDPDGSFVITVDNQPAGGRPNHLQLTTPTGLMLIRDTLGAWGRERPMDLSVTVRAPKQTPPSRNPRLLAERCARWVVTGAPYWNNMTRRYDRIPTNFLAPAQPTPFGLTGQFSSAGRFQLTADQALVVNLDPAGAPYAGFQIGTEWFISSEYPLTLGSLNNHQARPDADGTITYVLSPRDPGVPNWIDTSGIDRGLLFIRWQGAPAGVIPPRPATQLVAFENLPTALPAGTPTVTPEQREAQLAARLAEFMTRFEGVNHRLVPSSLP